MVSDKAFIFLIYIPWGKTLSFVPKSRSSVKVKVTVFEKMAVAGAFVYHKHILLDFTMAEYVKQPNALTFNQATEFLDFSIVKY